MSTLTTTPAATTSAAIAPAATTPAGSTTRVDGPRATAAQPCGVSGLEASR